MFTGWEEVREECTKCCTLHNAQTCTAEWNSIWLMSFWVGRRLCSAGGLKNEYCWFTSRALLCIFETICCMLVDCQPLHVNSHVSLIYHENGHEYTQFVSRLSKWPFTPIQKERISHKVRDPEDWIVCIISWFTTWLICVNERGAILFHPAQLTSPPDNWS